MEAGRFPLDPRRVAADYSGMVTLTITLPEELRDFAQRGDRDASALIVHLLRQQREEEEEANQRLDEMLADPTERAEFLTSVRQAADLVRQNEGAAIGVDDEPDESRVSAGDREAAA